MNELIFSHMYAAAMEQYGDREAIVDGDYRSTWNQHTERVARLTHALANQLKVSPADRFAVLALNSHQYLELWHAAFMGAGIINPLNLRLAPKELAYILQDSGSEVVFVDVTFAPLVEAARKLMEGRDPIRHVVLIGVGDVPHDVVYEAMLNAASPVMCDEPEETDPVVLMYTGGTTGLPKGVLIEHRAQILNIYHGAMTIPGFTIDTYLMQTPMFHAASMTGILASGVFGGRIVFIPMFNPVQVMELIEEHGVTDTLMVPTMIGMCLASEGYRPERLASLKQLVYGASPMPEATLNQLQSDLPDLQLIQGYGMTEACSTVTLLMSEDHQPGSSRLRSVGKPALGIRISTQDEEGNLLPRGEIGEVCVKGGHLMREYWNKPEATAEALGGGWYHTGDAGYIDDDGYLFLVDRVKDMIVTGGENVYSAEVESAISTHPGIAQVAVIGIPDDRWGEKVHAIVVPEPGATATAESIIAHTRELIAGYKVPKSVDFRSEPLPLSGAMKVLKRDLRAPYWEGRDKNIG
jgi:long-chain acyl-CoA synthetase